MPRILEDLTEEEAYLYAILSDASGLDIAEFCWTDNEQPDGCFRAWAFQWGWWRNDAPRQIECSARSVGKSLSIKVRAFAFPFNYPGQEMVITAPEGNHLDAITDIVETQFVNTRLGREMLVGSRSGIKHRPFHCNFRNGSRIMGRIPQRDGRGIKGTHPLILEMDESQDYPDAGWTEIIETVKQGSVGATWRAHGVTRGVRDYFYKFTQPDSGWVVHRYCAMHRPTWTDEERQSKIEAYGSKDHPDYRRNVLGLHGDATNPLFVLTRLMKCVDVDETSDFNSSEYTVLKINSEMVDEYDGDILALLDVPMSHLKYKRYWIGADIGFTNDPTEILVFAEVRDKKTEPSYLKLLTRVKLERISHGHQVDVMLWLIRFYQPVAYSMDKTGLGLPLFQDLQDKARKDPSIKGSLDLVKGYNFSSKILVDFDDSIVVDEYRGDMIKDAGIERNVLEYASDKLRALVDDKRILLPFDKTLIGEFQGQTWSYDKSKMDMYGRVKSYSKGSFHALDAARMAVLGWAQYSIEELTRKDTFEPVKEIFL
jgi:hypothetical protein